MMRNVLARLLGFSKPRAAEPPRPRDVGQALSVAAREKALREAQLLLRQGAYARDLLPGEAVSDEPEIGTAPIRQ